MLQDQLEPLFGYQSGREAQSMRVSQINIDLWEAPNSQIQFSKERVNGYQSLTALF